MISEAAIDALVDLIHDETFTLRRQEEDRREAIQLIVRLVRAIRDHTGGEMLLAHPDRQNLAAAVAHQCRERIRDEVGPLGRWWSRRRLARQIEERLLFRGYFGASSSAHASVIEPTGNFGPSDSSALVVKARQRLESGEYFGGVGRDEIHPF